MFYIFNSRGHFAEKMAVRPPVLPHGYFHIEAADKWDLIELQPEVALSVSRLFHRTHGAGYDWLGAIGVVLKSPHSKSRWFCSEWCAYAIGCTNPHRYTPGELADTIKP